jgi:hypothetical protein
MIEVTVDSIKVSLMSQHRVVVLKETDAERYLPFGSALSRQTL